MFASLGRVISTMAEFFFLQSTMPMVWFFASVLTWRSSPIAQTAPGHLRSSLRIGKMRPPHVFKTGLRKTASELVGQPGSQFTNDLFPKLTAVGILRLVPPCHMNA